MHRTLKNRIGLSFVIAAGAGATLALAPACSENGNTPGTGGSGVTAGAGTMAGAATTAGAGGASGGAAPIAGNTSTGGGGSPTGGNPPGGGAGGGGGSGAGPACKPTTPLNGSGVTVSATDISAFKYVNPPAQNMAKMAYDPVGMVVVILGRDGKMYSFDPKAPLPTTASTMPVTTTMPYNSGYNGTGEHRGIAFDALGNLYVMSANGGKVTIKKGTAGANRTWSDLVTTTNGYNDGMAANYNHSYAGIAVSPDGKSLFFSSGSRTEHGEEEGNAGVAINGMPATREVPLTSCIFKVPTDTPTVLNNDATNLPTMFADGTRNAFDMAFNAEGDLIACENGPDMDLPDEINFIEQGKHYGFPWRFGDVDNPTRDAAFDYTKDKRARAEVYTDIKVRYKADSGFPAPPAGVTFTDPIKNLGPDGNWLVPSATAAAPMKADAATGMAGITAHRSPLGIAFDTTGALCGEYYKQGFVLSYGPINGGSIGELAEDLMLISLKKTNGTYTMNAKILAKGIKTPIDSVLVGSRLFTIGTSGAGQVLVFALPTP
jgi:glucose/arabinose dehydrogenase